MSWMVKQLSSRRASTWRSPFYSPRFWDEMEDPIEPNPLPPEERIISTLLFSSF